ncbi:two-component system, OmpR family, sensor kinase [Burkholderiaceae bacterium]|nr:two-component system, OmpR family, sensor kinase [Burkholderiaceae bacterium]
MRLSDFIVESTGELVSAFEQRAGSPAAAQKTPGTDMLRESAAATLHAVALDMQAQPAGQDADAPHAHTEAASAAPELLKVAGGHALARFNAGFTIHQLVDEYRALRASVARHWLPHGEAGDHERLAELVRFNESIDKALMEAVSRYTEAVAHARDTLIGVLGHDLRNPLGSITMSAQYLLRTEGMQPAQTKAAFRVLSSAERMRRMVEDLLDYTRTRLGKGLPVRRAPVHLEPVLRQAVEELEALHPGRSLALRCSGELEGSFDGARLAQMLSNLISNAIQHGDGASPVDILVDGADDTLAITVRNQGPPIPAALHAQIFRPLLRNAAPRASNSVASSGLGLGLFIAREIARAHGGQIRLDSSDEAGTSFSVQLPRR